MNRRIALLRGVNVGTAKRLAMADFRRVIEGLGYTGVRTLLNSGNAFFTVPPRGKGDPAARIEAALASVLGLESRVIVVTAAQVDAIIAGNPLRKQAAENPSRFLVSFLADAADFAKLEPLLAQDWAPDALGIGAHAVYLWCPNGVLASKLQAAVARLLRDRVTSRNWTTTLQLQAKARIVD